MQIINLTGKCRVARNVRICRNLFDKTRGLMFVIRPEHDAYLFMFHSEKIVSLHTMFVFFPIDVVYLDSRKVVVETKSNVRPFTPVVWPGNRAMYIVEARAGLVKRKTIKIGDQFEFVFGSWKGHKLFKGRKQKGRYGRLV